MFHNPMFTTIARIFTYISLMAPLVASKALFFPFIAGKVLFFRLFTDLALIALAGALAYGEIPLSAVKNTLKRPIFIAFGIFVALFTLSAFTAQVPFFAFFANFERGEGAWQMLHYLLFFFVMTLLFQGKEDWRRLIGLQAAVGGFVALYAVAQALNWPSWIINPPTGQLSGSLGNPAYMGIYMLFCTFFAVWSALESRTKAKYLWFALAAFEAVMFFMAQNRGSFVGVTAGVMAILLMWLFNKKRGAGAYAAALILILAVVGGMAALVLTVKSGNALTAVQPRFWTWESALSGVIERPLTGIGPENFPFVFDEYYNPKHYRFESWFDRAHSTPLEYLVTGGIPLFLAYFAIFALLARNVLRKKDDPSSPFFAGMLAAYVVSCLVLFETLPLYLIFLLVIGLTDAFTGGFAAPVTPKRAASGRNALVALGACVATVLAGASIYATAYLPLRKNMLILDAMRTNGNTDVEIFQRHEAALLFPSPTGNEEELQGLLTFTVSYFDYIQKNRLSSQISKEKVSNIMKFVGEWYTKGEPHAIGVKTVYMRITGLLGAYQATKDAAYLAEADRLILQASAAAPTRIEFVRLAMASAALKGDRAAYAKELKKGQVLLPDIGWEPDMAKFVY